MSENLSLSEVSVNESEQNEVGSTTEIQNYKYDVTLSDDNQRLVFVSSDENSPIANFVLKLDDLLHHKVHRNSDISCYFIVRSKNFIWKLFFFRVKFSEPNSKKAELWSHCFEKLVKGPRKLLFIVNPICGDKTSEDYFLDRVEPLLKRIEIDYEVIYTKKKDETTEICSRIRENNEEGFDGVVLLSGDGTLNEALRGSLSFDQNSLQLKGSAVPLGIIPCGTSNTLAYTIHGSEDRDTALLHVLMGDKMDLDVMSVTDHSDNLLGFSLTLIAFGFIADAIQESERYKSWLKSTTRYTISFTKAIMRMKKYSASFEMWPSKNGIRQPQVDIDDKAVVDKQNCGDNTDNVEIKTPEQDMTSFEEANLFFANFYNHAGRCRLAPHGGAPEAGIQDGLIHIRIAGDITRNQASEIMKATGDTKEPHKPADCVTALTAEKVRFQHTGSGDGSGCLILDGEILFAPKVQISCHNQILPFFARGLETTELCQDSLIHFYEEDGPNGCLDTCTIL